MCEKCDQKSNIEKLFEIHSDTKDALSEVKIKQAEIGGDVSHIKARIDNGMSHTIANINASLTKLEPVLNHHSEVIRRIEGMGWTLATTLLLTLLGYLAWGIAHGFKVKI